MWNHREVLAAAAMVTGVMFASTALAGSCNSQSKVSQAEANGATFQVASLNSTTTAAADIVDTAVAAGSFTTLATALQAAGLIETLKGPGPFTVFAPTDEAFAKLPRETLNALLADKEALIKVLTYHVIGGRVTAAEVVELNKATTVEGSTLKIKANKKGVRVNDANVIQTDVLASNGVIHVIDTVLLPR